MCASGNNLYIRNMPPHLVQVCNVYPGNKAVLLLWPGIFITNLSGHYFKPEDFILLHFLYIYAHDVNLELMKEKLKKKEYIWDTGAVLRDRAQLQIPP